MLDTWITTPESALLAQLTAKLAERADNYSHTDEWPGPSLELCAKYGVHRWFASRAAGGFGWSEAEQIHGYLSLAAACQTTTFILTQRNGALRRIADSTNDALKQRVLPGLLSGQTFATVAISHLTTSRRHVGQPILRVEERGERFVLNGYSAWVTGGCQANCIVTGAQLDDGRQILIAVPTDVPGVRTPVPEELIALTASQTGPLELEDVELGREWLVAGPAENVMASAVGAKAGGLQTTTLAIGLAEAAIGYLGREAEKRPDLQTPGGGLRAEWLELRAELLAAALGQGSCSNEELRAKATSLVLRATQAALAAAKGAGFVVGHPAGRWAREALFYLVWSCPQPVANAMLCEFANLGE